MRSYLAGAKSRVETEHRGVLSASFSFGGYKMVIPFWGITGHFSAWLDGFYLVSAAGLWNRKRGKFVRRSYPDTRKRMFLDSGGFSFFRKFAAYPFTPDDYLALVRHYQPLVYASLDYPCEPDTAGSWTNEERIEATLDHLAYLKRADVAGLLPVVQGYTTSERLFCMDEMLKRGLWAGYVGVGSLCALRSVKQIAETVGVLADNAPDGTHFHLFGVKLDYFQKYEPPSCVLSADTAAWSFGRGSERKHIHVIIRNQALNLSDVLV